MKLPQIITSLLDQDFYKFKMGQFYLLSSYEQSDGSRPSKWKVEFRPKNGVHPYITEEMYLEIVDQIKAYCDLSFHDKELKFIADHDGISFDVAYINFLKDWSPNFDDFQITYSGGQFTLEVEGLLQWVTYYEVPVLAIISEVFHSLTKPVRGFDPNTYEDDLLSRTRDKVAIADRNYIVFSEFGTRRRFSKVSQELILKILPSARYFHGTSNVELAYKHGYDLVGSVGHEATMSAQRPANLRPASCNESFLRSWADFYRDTGVILTDTVTTDMFLRDFTPYALRCPGVRHDSGDPYDWADKMLRFYFDNSINPSDKILLFSDAITISDAVEIKRYIGDRAMVQFGIGTHLTNDHAQMSVVMKLVEIGGRPVAKLSDGDGKSGIFNGAYLNFLTIDVRERLGGDPSLSKVEAIHGLLR